MGKIIAICNQKGGTGKTTTAVNLATYVALIGKKTLLIDIDPQGNSTSGLGIAKDKIEHSIYDLIMGHPDVQKIIQPTQIFNLFLIPSNVELTGAEVELVGALGREFRLKKSLANIQNDFDFIFIDCPPSLGLLTVNALSAATCVVIPVQCEYYALEGLSLLLNTITLIKENLNASLEIEGVILTMADYRTKLTHEVINEARKHFGEKVYSAVVPRNVRLTEAPSFGKPIALYDKHSVGARQYQRLAYEFLKLPIPEEVLRLDNVTKEESEEKTVPENNSETIKVKTGE